MTEQNCPTGCNDPAHMIECFNCGAIYHYGLIHSCPTSVIMQPIHCHPAYVGSELACKECNPNCWQNHGTQKPLWCGDEKCPMNPNRPPTPEEKAEIDAWDRASANDWEEAEDELRKLGRKSIRIQGKYKARGKEKRREP